jgi:Ca2+-binding EF-hand superfamily protein
MDGDGFIDKEELYNMLKATVFGMAGIQLSDGQMKALVDNTFSEVTHQTFAL